MPSANHDALVKMMTERPALAVELLGTLKGAKLPETPLIRVENPSFSTRRSDDISADLVLIMGAPDHAFHAIIVEAQFDRSKEPKQLARYAAALWLMQQCDVTVLVICPNQKDAAHYAAPIESGLTGYRLQAQVLGPDDIPPIIDSKLAADHLELATLSVMMHGRNRKVVETFAEAIRDSPFEHRPKYYEYAYNMSTPETRRLLKEISMSSTYWPVFSPFAKEHYGRGKAEGEAIGKAEGKAEGLAKAILTTLAFRQLDVPDDVRERISSCTDLMQLETWLNRSYTAPAADALFDEDGEKTL
ncbi:hypothetical protein AB0K12_06775 [Nonomuraea sp. NPDC049419]|uniref:hypothetical protein n=1 Tax=Nonomuraea sp. NPDC049419 TaxID=3155772 RepID=UPI0034455B9E